MLWDAFDAVTIDMHELSDQMNQVVNSVDEGH